MDFETNDKLSRELAQTELLAEQINMWIDDHLIGNLPHSLCLQASC